MKPSVESALRDEFRAVVADYRGQKVSIETAARLKCDLMAAVHRVFVRLGEPVDPFTVTVQADPTDPFRLVARIKQI